MTIKRGALLGMGLAALVTLGAAVVYAGLEVPAAQGAPIIGAPAEPSVPAAVTPIAETAAPRIDLSAEDRFELAALDSSAVSVVADAAVSAALDPIKASINIYANPQYGEAPLTVRFEDITVPSDEEGPIVCWNWTFDVFDSDLDNDFEYGGGCGDQYRVVTHTYDLPGTYTVELTIRMRNPLPDGNARYETRTYLNLITAVGQQEQPPTASFSASDGIVDGNSLIALNDWSPLMFFTMTYGADSPAPRVLKYLTYYITCDRGPDHPWIECNCPRVEELLEFALWIDNGDDGPDGVFEPIRGGGRYDELLTTWDNYGYPYAENTVTSTPYYELNFVDDIHDRFPGDYTSNRCWRDRAISVPDQTWGYILTVRTSSVWRSGTVMGFVLSYPTEMWYYNPDCIPLGRIEQDSYSPENFSDIDRDIGYSSVFGVFDISGAQEGDYSWLGWDNNTWNWPMALYTPAPDHVRPVWDKLDGVIESGIGEWLDLRRVSSLETWVPVIGINLHGVATYDLYGTEGMQPGELNVICTDIGADPYGFRGNGGFHAQNGLEVFTEQGTPWNEPGFGWDYAFNGVWLYHDTNNNGLFDVPTPMAGGGVSFVDYPMRPYRWDWYWYHGMEDQIEQGLLEWQYDPFPPGGGDPWWKIKVAFAGGRRRDPPDTPTGYAEAIPDGPTGWVEEKCDYFVVVRADSGYNDSSTRDPDGVPISLGADTKVFIEPRRINPLTGFMDGGIRITGSSLNEYYGPREDYVPWQEDPRLDYPNDYEPWWSERTHNQLNTKPIRFGLDVHDLVLTYDSDNDFAKMSALMLADPGIMFCGDYYGNFDMWMDPFDVLGGHFYYGDIAAGTTTTWWTGAPEIGRDSLYKFQYPFETIPFENPNLDKIRLDYYPIVPPQPTLPDRSTWPYRLLVASGTGGVRQLESGTGTSPDDVYVFDVPGQIWSEDYYADHWLIDHKGGAFYITGNTASRLRLYQGHPVLDGDWIIAKEALTRGRYPHVSNWPEGLAPAGLRAARLLKQHTDSNSTYDAINNTGITNSVAMLGLNIAGADDPYTNRLRTVMLQSVTVAFWGPGFNPWNDLLPLDANGTLPASGVLLWENRNQNAVFDGDLGDGIVPLKNCAWSLAAEPVDIDGDRIADDLDGDGEVTASDNAWVLKLIPKNPWLAPFKDANYGDDLFVVVRPSRKIERFEQFRAIVASHMPNRPTPAEQEGGVSLIPTAYFADDSFIKNNPEESAVQDFYSHDMLEANIPCDVVNLTAAGQSIMPGGPPMAVLGIDVSTNRPASVARHFSGNDGIATPPNQYTTPGKEWSGTGVVGDYLVGKSGTTGQIETYKVTAAMGSTLTLQGGAPANGKYIVVRDPSFLEQVVVEVYDHDLEGDFNYQQDLVALGFEDPANNLYSGISIYRDNDWAAGNTNGVFDAGVDIPVALDQVPSVIGLLGGPTPIRFVFSSPGTDDLAGLDQIPVAQQPRRRQWVPDSFGVSNNDPDYGPDFFVVVRTSQRMELGDDFRIAIVSWGPNTPTEPDPDQFPTYIPNSGTDVTVFDMFSEFPWGSRGLGFITLFKNKPLYNYWTYDQVQRKQVPRVEQDHSQDENPYRYWVRTGANKFGQTNIITSLAAPVTDFVANYTRRAPGQPIQFTSLSTGTITNYFWDFGDDQTQTGSSYDVVTHSYSGPGFYTVALSVTDNQNATRTAIKQDYIQIVELPYADFVGSPTDAVMTPDNFGIFGVSVNFTDLSVGGASNPPVGFGWDFGDGGSSTEQNPIHRYTVDGTYSVRLTTTFQNDETDTYTREDYIVIRPPDIGEGEGEGEEGEGEGETPEVPTTSITIEDGIKGNDTHALLPLMDWMPLFTIKMTWDSEDAPAPRILESLTYTIREDPRDVDDLGYDSTAGPDVSDILEFALFEEYGDEDEIDGVLDWRDYPIYYWDNTGYPLGELVNYTQGNLVYELDFVGNGTLEQPQFPVREGSVDPWQSYIVAVRTSATWRSSLTLSYTVDFARMYPFPVNDDGEPVDSYSPNFYDDETLDEEVGYSSSFTVWDITNGPLPGELVNYVNSWTWPMVLDTPMAEHSRPRWDAPGQMFNFMTGEWAQMRTLFPLEQWIPMVGINIHSAGIHTLADSTHGRWTLDDVPYTVLEEVNVVVTDVGGDPLGEPGNGGLYAPEAFEPMVGWVDLVIVDEAIGKDHAFNGVSVWHDTNNNGIFDAPTPMAGGGAQLTDLPMWPGYEYVFSSETGYFLDVPTWEYVPFPPGGGDPWWKIKVTLLGWNRSAVDVEGALEKTPDGAGQNQYKPDYFVVVRADSGFEDISLSPPDGVGMTMGADFRVFIEPRRYNAVGGHWDGGIYADSQIPALGSEYYGTWQDDSRWGFDEPWWPQRTQIAENTKTVRANIDIHDLVTTYQSNNRYAKQIFMHYGGGGWFYIDVDPYDDVELPSTSYAFLGGYPTWFESWMDPFGLRQSQFYNQHSVGVIDWTVWLHVTLQDDYGIYVDDETGNTHFPYESAPFFNPMFDSLPHGPRSPLFATPPNQPSLPSYYTWPATITPGQYPRASDWAYADRQSRLLKQHVDIFSGPTPMLGFNLVGADDPITNRANAVKLDQITVAFWGPRFDPSKLMPLDPDGLDPQSGVMLYQDINNDGAFLWTDITGAVTYFASDTALALDGLEWGGAPEPIDLDGDGIADDMNGDDRVDTTDYAWVLTLRPKQGWQLPTRDVASMFNWLEDQEKSGGEKSGAARAEFKPALLSLDEMAQKAAPTKAFTEDNSGDDLFLVVRTSDQLAALEGFRAVVPATLPSRTTNKVGGVQLLPKQPTSPSALVKFNPEEGPVQDFFGHDMLEANVPVKVVDLTARPQTIARGGSVVPILGLDVSTNRPDTTKDAGASATTGPNSLSVAAADWQPGEFVNCWLIDEKYEAYLIMGNTRNQLTLLSGTPRGGPWRVVKDPTFLEQVVVEFYGEVAAEGEGEGEGSPLPVSRFNLSQHLLPLDRDPKVSGVALFRDNDNDPRNRNGSFDPDVDVPVLLDAPPLLIGQPGEPDTQVKFIFSSPGTDDWPIPMAEQSRRRQWVPDSFGIRIDDGNQGPDFFLVVRASTRMPKDTTFTAAIVGWGPNTPTEPDPDTFILPESPGTANDHFDLFNEFPWGSRALGFVTLFKDAPAYYYMDGAKARRDFDTSAGFVRTGSSIRKKTGVITAKDSLIGPYSVVVDSASQTQLPATVLAQEGFSFVITGQGFGSSAIVALTGYDVTVTQCTDTAINCTIRNTSDGASPAMPVVLIVRNPGSNEECSRDDLFTLTGVAPGTAPTIASVTPSSGTQNDFPIRINGANFSQRENLEVLLGRTTMPVQSVSADGKSVVVSFPFAGLPQSGPLDVIVRNLQPNSTKSVEAVLVNGFTYVNQPVRPCFIATAAYGSPFARHLPAFRGFRDHVLLKTSAGAAFVSFYYGHSPSVAEVVASHPALAAVVRLVLTPVAWVLENPAVFLTAVIMLAVLAAVRRRKCVTRA
ncbi:MAG TPA: PKD domain-containing protein [Candidatus Bathyarchaeia archaeon]|nr:PKD domain-containing protein [Candidatus Bathyarchaeia archaeon]